MSTTIQRWSKASVQWKWCSTQAQESVQMWNRTGSMQLLMQVWKTTSLEKLQARCSWRTKRLRRPTPSLSIQNESLLTWNIPKENLAQILTTKRMNPVSNRLLSCLKRARNLKVDPIITSLYMEHLITQRIFIEDHLALGDKQRDLALMTLWRTGVATSLHQIATDRQVLTLRKS